MTSNVSAVGNSLVGGMEQHPYDTPYAKMLEMRKDFQQLKAMLLAEQQQRAAEVTELRHEITLLRDALKKEGVQRESAVEKLMKDLAPVSKSNDFEQWRIQWVHSVEALEQALADEVRDRKATETMRDTREAARDTDIRSTINSLCKDFGMHKQTFMTVKQDYKILIDKCIHDIQSIGAGMQRVTKAWVSLPLGQMQTADSNGKSGVPQFRAQ